MEKHITDVIIHTSQHLDDQQFTELAEVVHKNEGVISLSRNANAHQCLMLVYNAGKNQARNILRSVTGAGVKAQLVGI